MARWIKSIKLDRKPTGIFCEALIGDKKGESGEIVYYHRWGGVDLQFGDGSIATFANDDVRENEGSKEQGDNHEISETNHKGESERR